MKTSNELTKVSECERFYIKDGLAYPRVSTILDVYPKPWLAQYHKRFGYGADERDEAARNFGTYVHSILETYFREGEVEYGGEEQYVWEMLQDCFRYSDENITEVIAVEETFVEDYGPEEYGYGGTSDLIAMIAGKKTLVDHKTSSWWFRDKLTVSEEAKIQLNVYADYFDCEEIMVFHFDKKGKHGFSPKKIRKDPKALSDFYSLYDVWELHARRNKSLPKNYYGTTKS